MSEKLWGGRYSKQTDKLVEEFTESISFDCRLAKYDVLGSVAHARMLAKCRIISQKEKDSILKGLHEILKELEDGKFVYDPANEDVHMNIEKALVNKIGEPAEKLHTARSRNDQVSLDERLYLREEVREILKLILSFQGSILALASAHQHVIIPGYTHMQHAQPVLFAHHMLAYIEMLQRDKERFHDALKRINVLPLGACALAGTSLPIDRMFVAKELGFDGVAMNSMDAVSDRDFVVEFLSDAAVAGMHLSRISEELILWSGTEFNLIDIDETFCTGSSIMPQKKNPDIAELARGKTGRLYGNLVSVLVMMKGLPLAYNRDMQEDKESLFDSIDTLKSVLTIFAKMFRNIKVNADTASKFAGDFSCATDMAEYLVKKGVSFRKAHKIVGQIVSYCVTRSADVSHLDLSTLKGFSKEFGNDIFDVIKTINCVDSKNSLGGTSFKNVEKELKSWAKNLAGSRGK